MAEEKEKSEGKLLEEKLFWKFPHIGKMAPEQIEEAAAFCEGYKVFLNEGKTERECVLTAVRMLEKAGYRPFERGKQYQPGDKVYQVNRHKSILATTFGQEPLDKGVRINGAHIDSPRLDLKPCPLYEKNEIAFFKTHYYGGIRKYQWGTVPLALHGVAVKKDGTTISLCIGEEPGDPVFCISDLLPHLAAKQNERKLAEGLKGEELNIIVGSLPFQDEAVKEPVKLMTMKLLYEKYGLTEADFFRAEIEMVPAQKAGPVSRPWISSHLYTVCCRVLYGLPVPPAALASRDATDRAWLPPPWPHCHRQRAVHHPRTPALPDAGRAQAE